MSREADKKPGDQSRDWVTVGMIMKMSGTDRKMGVCGLRGEEKLFGFQRGESLAHRDEQRPG